MFWQKKTINVIIYVTNINHKSTMNQWTRFNFAHDFAYFTLTTDVPSKLRVKNQLLYVVCIVMVETRNLSSAIEILVHQSERSHRKIIKNIIK